MLSQALQDLSRILRRTGPSWMTIREIDSDHFGRPDAALDVRDWGEWIVDPQDRYDPDRADECFEDWDWKVLSRASREQLTEIVKGVEKDHDVKIDVLPSEKNWMTFRIAR